MTDAAQVSAHAFREAMAAYPTGVTVVTALGPAGPAGMTASSVTSLSLEPPLILVCFARSARTLAAVRESGRFGVNFLAVGQERLADGFASKGPEAEKWAGVEWAERAGSPAIDGCLAWLGCELGELLEGGDHLIGIGAVVDVRGGEGEPLLYHRRRYRGFAAGGEPAELEPL